MVKLLINHIAGSYPRKYFDIHKFPLVGGESRKTGLQESRLYRSIGINISMQRSEEKKNPQIKFFMDIA